MEILPAIIPQAPITTVSKKTQKNLGVGFLPDIIANKNNKKALRSKPDFSDKFSNLRAPKEDCSHKNERSV
ncbi:MAG: hypothetical protein ACI9S8_000713 [Chlamydiales bacterium]|jgi:hypothetical protein